MKLKLLGLFLILAVPAFSAWSEYFEAVLANKNLQKLDILSIEQTQVYRCLGCYEFKITYRVDSKTHTMHAKTEKAFDAPKIGVELVQD